MSRTIQSYRSRFQDKERADRYAARFERDSRKRIDRREQRAVRKIFHSLKDCGSILDVPSGAGRLAGSLFQEGRKLLQIDVALEILQHAKARASRLEIPVVFAQGDASRLPLKDSSVDAIFCNRLLHHILPKNERAIILTELRRVTRRHLVVSFFDYQAFGALRRFLKRLKGNKINYDEQPTLVRFSDEVVASGFRIAEIVPTGPPWVSQKYFVLEKA